MLDKDTKEFIIQKLNELYLKQFYEDKNKNSKTYVEKKQCYLDLVKLIEENL